jgi:hypothetical protein
MEMSSVLTTLTVYHLVGCPEHWYVATGYLVLAAAMVRAYK